MKAVMLTSPGELEVTEVPDARLENPADAVVRIVAAGICGTDLRAFAGRPGPVPGPACGHEFVGVVEEIGPEVRTLRRGDLVVAPFMFADGTCHHCVRGVPTSCRSGGMWAIAAGGAQAEAIRVPFADATLVTVPMDERDERIPAVLALADVMATGHHATAGARALGPSATVAVLGDGAVGLCAVLAARRAGARRIFLVGRHESRLHTGKIFGATDLVTTRGDEARAQIMEATDGIGVDLVIDGVGEQDALDTASAVCADGGTLSLVGGPHGGLDLMSCFLRNVTVTGGLTPARRYLPELLGEVVAGRLDPGPVFDRSVTLDAAAEGYLAMARRQATKVLIEV
ncbi:zinc-binding dehydrogenase [Nocardia higoensis]|uniref:zinc-binding dehydrogenase n=1 Tax=Nocardia higoensis TaxID=228599 RepID=UPI000301313B|nr:alcohol dehydrogenase catalytic domain-containing protein [Nocardia higoensis]